MDSHTFSKTQPPTVTYSFPIILNSSKLYIHLLNYSQLLKLLPVTKNKQQLLILAAQIIFSISHSLLFTVIHINGSVIATTLSNSE